LCFRLNTCSCSYVAAYETVRNVTGVGSGPLVSFHDGFFGLGKWAGFLQDADRIALDYHPYVRPQQPCFSHFDLIHSHRYIYLSLHSTDVLPGPDLGHDGGEHAEAL
jgi:hypothetical protein